MAAPASIQRGLRFAGAVVRTTFGDIRGRALGVVVGCMICQMGLGLGYVFGPLAQDILGEMGWSRGEFSLTRLPQLAVMSAASPLIGTLTIRYGARRVLTASIVLLGVTFIGLSRIEGLYEFYLWMMLLGLALTGVGDLTVGQTVCQWVTRSRGLALALVYIGSNLGALLLIPLVVAQADRTSWRDGLMALGVGALVVMLPAMRLGVRERRAAIEPVGVTDATVATVATGNAGALPHPPVESDAGALDLRQALRTRSFWLLFFSLWTFFFYFLSLLEHLVLFLTDEGMDRGMAVNRYLSAIGLGIWSKLLLGLIADRIPEKQALLLDYGLLALSSLLLFALPDPTLTWVFIVTFGFSYAARDVVYPLIVTRCFGLRNMAQIYGALMVALVLGAAGPYFAARVHDETGSYAFAFQVFALLNLCATAGLFFVRDERVAERVAARPPQP